MSTSERRIYASAEPLLELYRINPAKVDGTGAEGAVCKGDVEAYLAGEQDEVPGQHSMTLFGVARGLTSEAIAERVRASHEGSNMQPTHVAWSISKERRRESAWWNDPEVQATLRKHRSGLKGVGDPDGSADETRRAASSGTSGGGS